MGVSQLQRLVSTGIRGCPGVGKPHTQLVSRELRGRAKVAFSYNIEGRIGRG